MDAFLRNEFRFCAVMLVAMTVYETTGNPLTAAFAGGLPLVPWVLGRLVGES